MAKQEPLSEERLGQIIHYLAFRPSGGDKRIWRKEQGDLYGKWNWEKRGGMFPLQEVSLLLGMSESRLHHLHAMYEAERPTPSEKSTKVILGLAKRRRLKPQKILKIRNQTLRKDAMEAYGLDRLIQDGGGELVQQDDFGVLWKLDFPENGDKFAMYLEVTNSTPEPDGHFAKYFLRVPPFITQAQLAVAWVGGLEGSSMTNFAGFAAQS